MTLQEVLDKKACSGTSGVNTGKLGCLSLFSTPTHFILTPNGFVIPKETEFNLAYVTTQVQKGYFIPLIDASTFEDVSAEDSYSTNSSGIKRLNLQGLPEYKLTFEEGHEFYKQISKLKSYKSYNVIIGDDENNWLFATKSDGDLKGFKAGHVTPEKTKNKVKGGDAESKAVVVQFLDRVEFDTNYGILHAQNTDFTAQEIPLVNGVKLEYVAVPANLDTTLEVKATLSSDRNSLVEGLVLADFLVTVNGSTVVPSLVTEGTPGVYTITIAALATNDVVVVDLFDGTLNVHTIKNTGVLYRADAISETAV